MRDAKLKLASYPSYHSVSCAHVYECHASYCSSFIQTTISWVQESLAIDTPGVVGQWEVTFEGVAR